MRTKDLEWLTTLAEIGHVTEASHRLGTSQPTLSRALARLEDELGTAVFVRTPSGVVPTPAGELVIDAARAMTERHQRLVGELQALLDPESGTVRLAFLDSIASSLVPRLLGDFHADAPRVRVLLRQEPAHEMLADLDAASVELAITSPRPPGDHGWHPLQEERLALVVPAGHRLAERRRVRLADLAGEELVTTPVGFGSRTLVDLLLRDAGVRLPVSFESQDLATIEGLVAAGLGVALVPETFAGRSGTVGVAIAAAGARRTVGLTWRTDRSLLPAAARFRAFVVRRSQRVALAPAP